MNTIPFWDLGTGNRICSKIEYEQQNDPWNVERFLEDLLLVVKGQSNLDIDGYL